MNRWALSISFILNHHNDICAFFFGFEHIVILINVSYELKLVEEHDITIVCLKHVTDDGDHEITYDNQLHDYECQPDYVKTE